MPAGESVLATSLIEVADTEAAKTLFHEELQFLARFSTSDALFYKPTALRIDPSALLVSKYAAIQAVCPSTTLGTS